MSHSLGTRFGSVGRQRELREGEGGGGREGEREGEKEEGEGVLREG